MCINFFNMRTTIKSLCIALGLNSILLLSPNTSKAQALTPGEKTEKINSYWHLVLQQTQAMSGASSQEFTIFNRFYSNTIDSISRAALREALFGNMGMEEAKTHVLGKRNYLIKLFNKFRKIEQEFPSSVDEYKVAPKFRPGLDSCYSSCNNTDFENGTLSGWYGYYGENNSSTSFNITNINGGYCGPVVKAAYDPLLAYAPDYQIRITGGATVDPFLQAYSTYSMPEVSPWGGLHSVMLGDSARADNDDPDRGTAILSQSFLVTAANSTLTYQYSLFLEDPIGHSFYEQPFFSTAVLDQNGDTIPTCGLYQVDALNAAANHFTPVFYPVIGDTVYWKPWTLVNVPLKKYIGQCVTIIFQVQDCSLGGHFGYAYVDATCSPAQLLSSSPNFCGQDSIILTAPPGAASYHWTGPNGGIRGSDSGQTVSIGVSGVYRVVTIPVTGALCADTIYDSIGKLPGPFPHPSFKADSVCVGQPITFINTSHPDSGQFSWDFYNIGIYNYTAIPYQDTTWTYATTGTYSVKLHQLANGCGLDTVIKVGVYNPPVTSVSPKKDTVCPGQSVVITGSGAGVYKWSTGSNGSSITVAPLKTTRYYLRDSLQGGPCLDTASALIIVRTAISATISHDTSICPNQPVTLSVKATGEPPLYTWTNNGATTSSIQVAPSTTTVYTAVVSGFYCGHDTLNTTVNVVQLPVPVISGPIWRCSGDKDTLSVTSSTNPTTYVWDNGSKDTFLITGDINADSIISVTAYNSLGCPAKTTYTVQLLPPPTPTINPPTIFCAGQAVTLSATATGIAPISPFVYSWSTGQTGTSITINPGPDSATTYTVSVSNGCIGRSVTTAIPNIPILSACCDQTLYIEHDSTNRHDTTILVAQGNSIKYQWQESPNTGTITCLDPLCDSVMVVTYVTTTYTVTGTDTNGCQTSQLLLVNIDIPCYSLVVPNVITPNEPGPEGLDDKLYIRTEDIDAWEITIFNRWGKEVYHSTDQYQYWNGNTESGAKAEDGVYYYVINATCQNATYKKEGFIQLIR